MSDQKVETTTSIHMSMIDLPNNTPESGEESGATAHLEEAHHAPMIVENDSSIVALLPVEETGDLAANIPTNMPSIPGSATESLPSHVEDSLRNLRSIPISNPHPVRIRPPSRRVSSSSTGVTPNAVPDYGQQMPQQSAAWNTPSSQVHGSPSNFPIQQSLYNPMPLGWSSGPRQGGQLIGSTPISQIPWLSSSQMPGISHRTINTPPNPWNPNLSTAQQMPEQPLWYTPRSQSYASLPSFSGGNTDGSPYNGVPSGRRTGQRSQPFNSTPWTPGQNPWMTPITPQQMPAPEPWNQTPNSHGHAPPPNFDEWSNAPPSVPGGRQRSQSFGPSVSDNPWNQPSDQKILRQPSWDTSNFTLFNPSSWGTPSNASKQLFSTTPAQSPWNSGPNQPAAPVSQTQSAPWPSVPVNPPSNIQPVLSQLFLPRRKSEVFVANNPFSRKGKGKKPQNEFSFDDPLPKPAPASKVKLAKKGKNTKSHTTATSKASTTHSGTSSAHPPNGNYDSRHGEEAANGSPTSNQGRRHDVDTGQHSVPPSSSSSHSWGSIRQQLGMQSSADVQEMVPVENDRRTEEWVSAVARESSSRIIYESYESFPSSNAGEDHIVRSDSVSSVLMATRNDGGSSTLPTTVSSIEDPPFRIPLHLEYTDDRTAAQSPLNMFSTPLRSAPETVLGLQFSYTSESPPKPLLLPQPDIENQRPMYGTHDLYLFPARAKRWARSYAVQLRHLATGASEWASSRRPKLKYLVSDAAEEDTIAGGEKLDSYYVASVLEFAADTLPTHVYLIVLLQLPSFYFSRVARLFEEAELAMPEMQQMAIRTSLQAQNYLDEQLQDDHVHVFPFQWMRLKNTWEAFIESLLREWKTFNIISALLLTAILTILQIQSAANDPLTRYTALLSLICSLISLLFGCVYIIRFGTMRKTYKAAEWALEAQGSKTFIWWNVWILLAMPAIWLTWSIILYILCIMSFIWRSSSGDPNSDAPTLSPRTLLILRIGISVVLGLGILYTSLILATFRRYGSAMDVKWQERIKQWQKDSETTPLFEYPPPQKEIQQPPATSPIFMPIPLEELDPHTPFIPPLLSDHDSPASIRIHLPEQTSSRLSSILYEDRTDKLKIDPSSAKQRVRFRYSPSLISAKSADISSATDSQYQRFQTPSPGLEPQFGYSSNPKLYKMWDQRRPSPQYPSMATATPQFSQPLLDPVSPAPGGPTPFSVHSPYDSSYPTAYSPYGYEASPDTRNRGNASPEFLQRPTNRISPVYSPFIPREPASDYSPHEIRIISPSVADHDHSPSVSHRAIVLPPDNNIPILVPDSLISLPPPHELNMPSPKAPLHGLSMHVPKVPPHQPPSQASEHHIPGPRSGSRGRDSGSDVANQPSLDRGSPTRHPSIPPSPSDYSSYNIQISPPSLLEYPASESRTNSPLELWNPNSANPEVSQHPLDRVSPVRSLTIPPSPSSSHSSHDIYISLPSQVGYLSSRTNSLADERRIHSSPEFSRPGLLYRVSPVFTLDPLIPSSFSNHPGYEIRIEPPSRPPSSMSSYSPDRPSSAVEYSSYRTSSPLSITFLDLDNVTYAPAPIYPLSRSQRTMVLTSPPTYAEDRHLTDDQPILLFSYVPESSSPDHSYAIEERRSTPHLEPSSSIIGPPSETDILVETNTTALEPLDEDLLTFPTS